jgi:hypothetical protein
MEADMADEQAESIAELEGELKEALQELDYANRVVFKRHPMQQQQTTWKIEALKRELAEARKSQRDAVDRGDFPPSAA